MDAHPGGVLFYTDVYCRKTFKIQNVLLFGSLSGSTWVEKAFVSGSTGNIGTNGTITAGGNLNVKVGHSQVLANLLLQQLRACIWVWIILQRPV